MISPVQIERILRRSSWRSACACFALARQSALLSPELSSLPGSLRYSDTYGYAAAGPPVYPSPYPVDISCGIGASSSLPATESALRLDRTKRSIIHPRIFIDPLPPTSYALFESIGCPAIVQCGWYLNRKASPHSKTPAADYGGNALPETGDQRSTKYRKTRKQNYEDCAVHRPSARDPLPTGTRAGALGSERIIVRISCHWIPP